MPTLVHFGFQATHPPHNAARAGATARKALPCAFAAAWCQIQPGSAAKEREKGAQSEKGKSDTKRFSFLG